MMGSYAENASSGYAQELNAYLGNYTVSLYERYWGLNLGSSYDDDFEWSKYNTVMTAKTVNKIDVTGYTKLSCYFYGNRCGSGYYTGWQKAVVGICSTNSTGSSLLNANNYYKKTVSDEIKSGSPSVKLLELDLSDVKGEYYICFSIISRYFSPGGYGQSFYAMKLN